jgi:flavorubredoxin
MLRQSDKGRIVLNERSFARTGNLPRQITESCLWSGGCIPSSVDGMHAHYSFYAIRGREKTLLVDTGHPMHWPAVQEDIARFLGGRTLDYIFPTHSELPHSGLLEQWLHAYPESVAVGDLRDYGLYYPQLTGRFRQVSAGDRLDLGDRELLFVPPVWRDLPDTLWAFDTADRILFLSDACAYFHAHAPDQCDHFSSEVEPPDIDMMRYFNDKALHWPRYTDSRPGAAEFDALMAELSPRLLAGAHGCVVDTPEAILPRFKTGLAMAASG